MTILLSLVVLCVYWIRTEACDGYKLHVRKFENCNENSILKLENFNVSLTDDCIVVPSGCIVNSKEVHSATVTYSIVHNMAPFTGTKDGCKTLGSANEEAAAILEMFAIPTSCPIKKGKICNDKNKSVDIRKYRRKLPLLLGDIQATVMVETDVGKACLEFKGSVTKKLLPKLPMLG